MTRSVTEKPRQTLSGPEIPAKSGHTRQVIVFLHGVGADGNDLISLAPIMQDALPDAHFISPNAPFPCDMAPFGRQWFSLQVRQADAMLEGLRQVQPLLDQFINDTLSEHGVSIRKLGIVGFSQGTMTALHTMLRRNAPCGAIVGFSGALIGSQQLATEVKACPPVCLIHGDADPVVPYALLADAEAALSRAGVEVEAHTRPGLQHSIDPQGLESAKAFLRRHLL